MPDKDQYQSAWSQSIPAREQFKIIRRMFTYAKPYKRQFGCAIVGVIGMSAMNIALPFILQEYMDRYLRNMSATTAVILGVASLYGMGTIIKPSPSFSSRFCFKWAVSGA